MIFFFPFSLNSGFWVFLVQPTVVSVLLSASVARCFVSHMRDFFRIVMYRFGNGAPICIVCIGWESQCLPDFLRNVFQGAWELDWEEKGGCFSILSKYVVMCPFLTIEICRQRIGEEPARM